MSFTPLYKKLKNKGTSFYCFPSSTEDYSAAYQNPNYKTYFSKYALLNIPNSDSIDFEVFKRASTATSPENFSDQIIESLRNYVANHEVVVKESRLNNTEYYYNPSALETTTEKIFYKWCKKIGILQFEPAVPEDEYFSNLSAFTSNNITDENYFPEFLWKERETTPYSTITFKETGDGDVAGNLEITISGTSNLKKGDTVLLYNISNTTITGNITGYDTNNGIELTILKVIPADDNNGQRIILDIVYTITTTNETTGKIRLIYNKLIQYIGEINGVSNIQNANRSYTEIYAHIPDHTGQTPDILFRTRTDANYKPNMIFPIIPSQYQPEIMGAELFNSPIVSNPLNYPGSYFGQFDTDNFTYESESGDELRRSGDYFGLKGDINNPLVDSSKLDGITLDFDISHYVKMNILNRSLSNFDQFNALSVNNEPPKDFEFNSILWYYTVEDNFGNKTDNLYGISFLDNPDNNQNDSEVGIKFPTYKKFVANGEQDGTSYAFNLNLNYNIINENPQDLYNPDVVNSTFNMNLFNEAMSTLSNTNDNFMNIIYDHGDVMTELNYIKQLLYTQTDISVVNNRISNLESLLKLYSTNQLISTDSIEVVNNNTTPATISLYNTNTGYDLSLNYKTKSLFNESGPLVTNINVVKNRDFLINIVNNDDVNINSSDIDWGIKNKLTLNLSSDLSLNQSVCINITSDINSLYNKKMDIFLTNTSLTPILLVGDINLPVYKNDITNTTNSAYNFDDFNFDIDFNKTIKIIDNKLELSLSNNSMLINKRLVGDNVMINNLHIATASNIVNYSGQFKIDEIDEIDPQIIKFNIDSSLLRNLTNGTIIHGTQSTSLGNVPYFSLNKGEFIKITRVSNSESPKDRYIINRF